MRRRKRRRHGILRFFLLILACICIFLILIMVDHEFVITPGQVTQLVSMIRNQEQSSAEKYGWNLILVNRDHPIPENYEITFTELSNGQKVDSRIYPKLQEMFDAARAQGIYPFVAAGYRTAEKQQSLMDEKIEEYRNEGKSDSEARKLAKEWVAVPGTSEHQLGLSVDINADTTRSSSDAVFGWLLEHAHEFGFVKRYPADKTEITGIINEPWHYRYVGVEAAKVMVEEGICLEEYIEELDRRG